MFVGTLTRFSWLVCGGPGQGEALLYFWVHSDEPMSTVNGLEWVERSWRLIGDNHVFLNNKALALQKRNRFEDSIESVQLALAFKSDFAQAFLTLGHARRELKQDSDAVNAYENALTL